MSGEVRRSDVRDNRQRILTAARAALAEGPAVTVREVANRAGLGVATVYRHFGSREELLGAALRHDVTTCSAIVEQGLASSDPWVGFRSVIERLMEHRAVDGETFDRDRNLRLMLALLDRAKRAGRLRRDLRLEDISLALTANQGLWAAGRTSAPAASRRFANLMLASFEAR